MIEIRHKETGKVLHTVQADTLEGTILTGVNLTDALLPRALLHNANLTYADLTRAILTRANMTGANMTGAILTDASLFGADLTGAILTDANLRSANLIRTGLHRANLWDTILANCPTLHQAKGLETIVHDGASILDARTLRACVNHLPDVFLRGVGYNQEEIENLRAMYAGGGIKYYSCFIAYRRDDYSFARYLHDQLEAAGVTCWLDERDMQGGKYERPQIQAAIKAHDKLLLICSEEMVMRPRVVEEVIAALQAEREGAGRKLFPVRLDEYICSKEVLAVADEKLHKEEWSEDWIRAVQAYHIPDFQNWKDHDRFQEQFQRLLRDLKAQSYA